MNGNKNKYAKGGEVFLDKKYNFDDYGIKSYRELIDAGKFRSKFKSISNASDFDRIKFNRMRGKEQVEYVRKLNKQKIQYNLKPNNAEETFYTVKKEVFDYANIPETEEKNFYTKFDEPTQFIFAKGGGVDGKTYEIKGADVTFYEDSYADGELDQFHSYYLNQTEFPYKTKFSSKQELFDTLNEFISYADLKEDDFFIDEDTIQTSALVKYEKGSDWDEFSAPTEKEKELWRKGKMKLYSAQFVFPYEVYKKEKLEFAKGGMTKGGTTTSELKAPNGQTSNLTPVQYELVRTPAFKKWFGDWENDPTNASKVVDENGEPMVVYHGTDKKINIFKSKTEVKYFAKNKEYAEEFGDKIYECFLNIRKLLNAEKFYLNEVSLEEQKNFLIQNGIDVQINKNDKKYFSKFWLLVATDNNIVDKIKLKYDGLSMYENYETTFGEVPENDLKTKDYCCFYPNQIKLADGTNTTFDGSNLDIRFEEGGMTKGGSTYQGGGELKGKFIAEIGVPYNYERVVQDEFEFTEFLSKTLTKKWFGNGVWKVKIVKPLFETNFRQKIVVEIDIPIGVTQGGALDEFEVIEFLSKTLTKKWFGNGVWSVEITSTYQGGGEIKALKQELKKLENTNSKEAYEKSNEIRDRIAFLEAKALHEKGSTYQGGGEIQVGDEVIISNPKTAKKFGLENNIGTVTKKSGLKGKDFSVKFKGIGLTEWNKEELSKKGGSTYQGGGEIYTTLAFKTKKEADKNAKEIEDYFNERFVNSEVVFGTDERGKKGYQVNYELKKESGSTYAEGGKVIDKDEFISWLDTNGVDVTKLKFTHRDKNREIWIHSKKGTSVGSVVTYFDFKEYESMGEEGANQFIYGYNLPLKGGSMASGGKITDSILWRNGEIIDDWASDVGGSNESRDNVIEYNGKHYLVVTNFDQDMLLTPSKNSQIWEDAYAKGGKVEKKGNEMIIGGLAGILLGIFLNK
jgi:hypothetical protein